MADNLLIFGVRPVIEAIEAGKQFDRIYIKRGADSPVMEQLKGLCRERKVAFQEVPIEKLNRLTRGNHQGVVAQTSAIEYANITEIAENVKAMGKLPLFVVLDGVTDVRNFGAIARTAECAGVDALIVPLKNSAPVNSDAIKSSAGALHTIPVCRVGSVRNTLKNFKGQGMQLIAATEKSDKQYYKADFTKPTVLIMGAEDVGISNEVLKLCDEKLAIPVLGKIESLNVSVAAGVMLYEVVRQRKEI